MVAIVTPAGKPASRDLPRRAQRVQFDRYGEAAEMYVADYEVPVLQRGQVRVKVRAAAVNPLDWKQRRGDMKLFMNRRFPKGIGSDFAGVIEAIGEGVGNVQVGDDVLGTLHAMRPGALAEALVTDAHRVVKKPSRLSFAEAACLPIPAATAWAALIHKAQLPTRSRVFIHGCTGAVGSLAVQLAIANGARVAGTCSQASMPAARLAGVAPVFDYADPALWDGLGAFDVIFDTAGTLDVGLGLSKLGPRGVFLDINPTLRRALRGMLSRRYKLVFATMGTKHLPEIGELAARGILKPAIGQELPLSDAVAAITAAEAGQRSPGRAIITFPDGAGQNQ